MSISIFNLRNLLTSSHDQLGLWKRTYPAFLKSVSEGSGDVLQRPARSRMPQPTFPSRPDINCLQYLRLEMQSFRIVPRKR
ncbi:hypothetical protein HCDG_05692 [Histoplasma capsulatum H143]|uniref:Uncharacterized protein n=1 Tax=Ajellomyces capsulatus (strain H143) TaxID=544712 RepID=C6HHL1_AJECH|nr:hypothetical protein HCDG_05692 [Histoplasma capsulatum H143]